MERLPQKRAQAIAFSPDGQVLVTGGACCVDEILSSAELQQELFGMLIILAILIGGLRAAFGMLPSSERNFVGAVIKGLVNLLLGTGNKGKK